MSLFVLLAVVAIVLDGGTLLQERRHAQATADAAAQAAAIDLYENYATNKGYDTYGTAQQSALTTAAANGYTNDTTHSTVTVNIPPQSGEFVNKAGYAEVIVQFNQSRSFSNIFASGAIPVKARAVARAEYNPNIGILVLDPTVSGALNLSGSSTVTVPGSVIVNSNNSTAAKASGSAGVNASEIDITGTGPGYSSSSSVGFQAPTIKTGVAPTADPLAALPAPDPNSLTVQSSSTYKTDPNKPATLTLQPGVYKGGIEIKSTPGVVMESGTYYLEGHGLTMSGGSSTLTANGVMIYNGPDTSGKTGKIDVSGGGTVTMSPPTSGAYSGIAIFQDRTSTQPITLSGGSGWDFTGTVYAAKGLVTLSGDSGATMGSQYISDKLTLSGSSGFNLSGTGVSNQKRIRLVE
jgi:Flp pilus assembly protein TadG